MDSKKEREIPKLPKVILWSLTVLFFLGCFGTMVLQQMFGNGVLVPAFFWISVGSIIPFTISFLCSVLYDSFMKEVIFNEKDK